MERESSKLFRNNRIYTILLSLLLVGFIVFDLSYTFRQFYLTPIDGDMAGGVVPAEDVKPILEHPLGLAVIHAEEAYPNPNKFFSHWTFYHYFNHVPNWLQHFVSPLDSVYLACAIAKILMQILLLWLMAVAVTGFLNPFRLHNLIVIALFSTLFQTYGYHSYMGIIDPAITYSFFYALPIIFLAIYLIPYWLCVRHGKSVSRIFSFLWLLWIPLATLSGPLNPGIALIIILLLGVHLLFHHQRSSTYQLITFVPLALASVYSLFIGTFNSISQAPELDLWSRYAVLPKGLFTLLTGKLSWLLIILTLVINSILVCKWIPSAWKQIKRELWWVLAFSLIYILLLPFGGYRDYRPYILRYDTFLPVTLCFIYLVISTSLRLLTYIKGKKFFIPLAYLLLFAFAFENADNMNFTTNSAERNAIATIATSPQPVVPIPSDCKLASWYIISQPEDSKLICDMFVRFNVFSPDKRFYNQ